MDPAKLQAYREGWRRRRDEMNDAEIERFMASTDYAQAVADRLRSQWGAREVYLFGSVAKRRLGRSRVREDSDIDIAVTGIAPSDYFAVLADVEKISPIQLDLVLMEDCSPGLYESIKQDGILL